MADPRAFEQWVKTQPEQRPIAWAELSQGQQQSYKNFVTLADGWAYARFYTSESERRAALPGWLHFYNHHRPHSAIGGQAPITRLTNVPGHHS